MGSGAQSETWCTTLGLRDEIRFYHCTHCSSSYCGMGGSVREPVKSSPAGTRPASKHKRAGVGRHSAAAECLLGGEHTGTRWYSRTQLPAQSAGGLGGGPALSPCAPCILPWGSHSSAWRQHMCIPPPNRVYSVVARDQAPPRRLLDGRGGALARRAHAGHLFFYHSPPVPVFAPTSPNNLDYLLAVSKNLAHPLHPVYDNGKGGGWKWWE